MKVFALGQARSLMRVAGPLMLLLLAGSCSGVPKKRNNCNRKGRL